MIAAILLALQALAGAGRIFKVSQEYIRTRWRRACVALGMPFAGPLHTIRHTAPSEDLARATLSIEGVRRRGRWRSLDSVQRYSKTFALTKFRARVPAATLKKGAEAAGDLRLMVCRAMAASGSAGSTLHRAVEKELLHLRTTDAPAEWHVGVRTRPGRGSTARGTSLRATVDDEADLSAGEGWATD